MDQVYLSTRTVVFVSVFKGRRRGKDFYDFALQLYEYINARYVKGRI